MTHKNIAIDTQNAREKLDYIDDKLGGLYLEMGKLDALANLIDSRSDNKAWQASERAQFAMYLCCGMITKIFHDVSDTHNEYQTILTELQPNQAVVEMQG